MLPAELAIDRVHAARRRIEGWLHRTPVVRSGFLSRRLGAEVYLKLENQQKTGSFKPRGALVSMLDLGAEERARGVVTISAGNHAQGVAFAGQALGIPATVVMPQGASRLKAEAARGYGAQVILHGDVRQAFARVEELRRERGLVMVHPFDSPGAILGQATLGLEIVEDLPDVDLVVAGIGGGGLASGLGVAIAALRPSARVHGVEPAGAAAMRAALDAGKVVALERIETVADGLAAPFAGALNLEVIRETLADVVLVEDAEIVDAMKVLLERMKTVAEPAGAAATAALLHGRVKVRPGSRVVAVVSGGNVAAADLARLVS